MNINRTDFNDSKLIVSDNFDKEKEIEINIISLKETSNIWLTKEEVKILINHLVNIL